MDKKLLSEREIYTKYITPAVREAGWDVETQIREEVSFTKGRIIVHGKLVTRGKGKRADYIIYYKPNIPIALIEAKDNNHGVGYGIQQGLVYAETLNIPFVFSSNGDGFVFHDKTGLSTPKETALALAGFPSPQELWPKYREWKGLPPGQESIVLQDYHDDGSGKASRDYQVNAIDAAIEAIAKRQDRILLVMATGTGKTYTAFQIIWRLWKVGRKKRILFLADRNVLVDQTMVNDFRPFGAAMAKLRTRVKTIEREDGTGVELTAANGRKRRIDTAYEVYLGLYQAVTGPEERQKLFREYSPGFYDLINLHTFVRLPNSVFKPYASIGTDLLFFEKGGPTKETWFYEHHVPEDQKAYSMIKPIRFEHLKPCADWWSGAKRRGREETEVVWKVTADAVKERGYNLDFQNSHTVADDHGDPEELLARFDEAETQTAALRDQLKGILEEALLR